MIRILVVDDEPDICAILQFNLEKAGFEVSAVHSAEAALDMGIASYNLLLLDVMLDGMSGFDLARLVKKNPETEAIPVIFITAKDSVDDAVAGLDLGADDYISKPFSVKEIISRVNAVLRRVSGKVSENPIVIDDEKKVVRIDNELVSLSRTEYDILKLLTENPGRVFSRNDLIERVWRNDAVVTERTVDVGIARLRKKMGKYAGRIVSRHGFGYCFE